MNKVKMVNVITAPEIEMLVIFNGNKNRFDEQRFHSKIGYI